MKALALGGVALAGVAGAAVSTGSTATGRPPACRVSRLGISPAPGVTEKTGQHSLAIRLTNLAGGACRLDGYPRVALSDARGVLPFRIRLGDDTMITARAPTPLRVRRRGHAYVVINKYRCDRGDRRLARTLRLRLPSSAPGRHLTLRVPPGYVLGYCGEGDPGSTVTTSPFERTVQAALR